MSNVFLLFKNADDSISRMTICLGTPEQHVPDGLPFWFTTTEEIKAALESGEQELWEIDETVDTPDGYGEKA